MIAGQDTTRARAPAVKATRRTRFHWIGHTLRLGPSRILFRTTIQLFHSGDEGNLWMDVPSHLALEQLIAIASDRPEWKQLANSIFCTPQLNQTQAAQATQEQRWTVRYLQPQPAFQQPQSVLQPVTCKQTPPQQPQIIYIQSPTRQHQQPQPVYQPQTLYQQPQTSHQSPSHFFTLRVM